MARSFASRFRRVINGPFAGDGVPAGAQVLNNLTTGVGVVFRMGLARADKPDMAVRRYQGYWVNTAGAFAGTLTLTPHVAAGDGTAAGDWIQWGPAVGALIALVLHDPVAVTEDADLVVQVTPSVALIGGEQITLYLEEVD